jgi:hypothetical protein
MIQREAFGVRSLGWNGLVDFPTSHAFAIQERVIIKDHKGNCYLVNLSMNRQERQDGSRATIRFALLLLWKQFNMA